MAVTIHDIAKELGLSAMTVSRVLSQPDNALVTPATRDRVTQAALKMGYRPNRNARALASRRTRLIGLWIDHLKSSVYTQIVQACRGVIQESGMDMRVNEMAWHFSPSEIPRHFEWPVDGILVVDPPDPEKMNRIFGSVDWQSVPRVHLGSGQHVPCDKDYVWIDLEKGTRTAVDHLLRSGRQRIVYVTPIGLDQPGMSHFDGYNQVLRSAGRAPECIVCADWDCSTVRQVVREYIQQHGQPDGIFCHHDEMAIATYRALRDLNLEIPRDVAIIGCEGNEFLEYFDPPISTVALPIEEMCHRAWQLLQQRIDAPESDTQGVTLPYKFLSRASSW